MTEDFWKRCSDAGCAVLPIKTYSHYVDGNLHESAFTGLRYAALPFEDCAVGPDCWFMIDESGSGLENLFESPMAALEAFEKRSSRRRGED